MPAKKTSALTAKAARRPLKAQVQDVLAALKQHGTRRRRDEMKTRYGIDAPKAFGVSMATMQQLAKHTGRNHELAAALWDTGWYEARMLTAYIDEPELVTSAQMDRWAREFDNWAICDTLCFALFDRTPHAWRMIEPWSKRREFVKRAAFALLACLALHDKDADDRAFARYLPLIERAAADERNFVKKGVSWALRAIGGRSLALNAAAVSVAQRLAASLQAAARWVGKDALRDITRPAVKRRLEARRRASS